jgi:hypothetical protein
MLKHQLVLHINHDWIGVHIPFPTPDCPYDLNLLHLRLRIHDPLGFRTLRFFDYLSQLPVLRSQSQPRHQDVPRPPLGGYLPEYQSVYGRRAVQRENRVVRRVGHARVRRREGLPDELSLVLSN